MSVAPLARLGRAVSCSAPPTATVTWAGLSTSPTTPVVWPAAVRPGWLRPGGVGLWGVLRPASNCDAPPFIARVINCVRTGSSGASGAAPNEATAASTVGQRFAASFSSIFITASAIAGGQSARAVMIGGGGSLKCAYMIAITDSCPKGRRPDSIS